MNYYQFHIGDFRGATAHLSNEEELAYRRALDWYYDKEEPLPDDTLKLSRRLRVSEKALSTVLDDFFTKTSSGWAHERCDEEIEIYQKQAEKNRANGKKGGRPKKATGNPGKTQENPVGSQSDSTGNPLGCQSKPTGKATSNHKPGTNNQLTPLDPPSGDPPKVVSCESTPEKPKRRRKLPEDFTLTDHRRSVAVAYWLERDRPDLIPEDEFEKFLANHRSKGSTMADWDAAWKTWYCNAVKFNQPPRGLSNGHTPTAKELERQRLREATSGASRNDW